MSAYWYAKGATLGPHRFKTFLLQGHHFTSQERYHQYQPTDEAFLVAHTWVDTTAK